MISRNKRDLVLSVINAEEPPGYIPAAFFMHFGDAFRVGEAAVDKHLAFYRHTGMDFVKIQYEHAFPQLPNIKKPADWSNMPLYNLSFYEQPLHIIKELVKAAKSEALVILTLYSPFMCAGHTTSNEIISEHLRNDPLAVCKGLEVITESLLLFVKASFELGIDGFYASTQGAEAYRFTNTEIFDNYIKPYDITLLTEINNACEFNILHICDYHGTYTNYSQFVDYPGDVVNCNLQTKQGLLTSKQASLYFERPFMGGVDRHGAMASGNPQLITQELTRVLDNAPSRMILGADCTIPGQTNWDHIAHAIDIAHNFKQ